MRARKRQLCIALAVGLSVVGEARGQDACNQIPIPIEDIANVHDTYLILRSASGADNYVLDNPCTPVQIDRQVFGTKLHFFLFNRLKNKGLKTGTVYIRSQRTFSNTQYVSIKWSRGEGWYYPSSSSSPITGKYDVPFSGTVDAWNSVYGAEGTPEDFNSKLGAPIHAYGDADKSLPSTFPAAFWKSNQPIDTTHDVLTYYLIHFEANTTSDVSLIPFNVAFQPQVQLIKLSIFSNVEELNGDYEFVPK